MSIIYVTESSIYIASGDKTIRLPGNKGVSPVVGSIPGDTNKEVLSKIHNRESGYQELYSPVIGVGDKLVRDWPENRPNVGISSVVQEIVVVAGDLETAIEAAKEKESELFM